MFRVIPYALVESLLLAGTQVMLKLALQRIQPFGWSRAFWGSLLVNWQFALSGLLFASSSLLWMYIVRIFPFSQAYPMVSLSYVFGMLAALLVFHEQVSVAQWTGVALIVLGCILIAR